MGSMCCKRTDSPYSPKLPDIRNVFYTCADQIQICRKNFMNDEEEEEIQIPKQRKYNVTDISHPLPLGCTVPPPRRPLRKKKRALMRTTSVLVASPPAYCSHLKRSKSVHEIQITGDARTESSVVEESEERPESADAEEIVLNVIRAVGGPSVELDEPIDVGETEARPSSPSDSSTTDEEDPHDAIEEPPILTEYLPNEQADYNQRPLCYDYSCPVFPPLEPILESAYESLESNSSSNLVAENKRHFLASLLEENNNSNNNNNNNNLPSRKSSITESLQEFECSLYDMLEEEPAKDDLDENKWRPQIPVYSYH